jgi:hypothetical protein
MACEKLHIRSEKGSCVTDVMTQSESDSSEQKAESLPDSVVRGFDDRTSIHLSE